METLNIFLNFVIFILFGWVVWLIIDAILNAVAAPPIVRKVIYVAALVLVLILIVAFLNGNVTYYRLIR